MSRLAGYVVAQLPDGSGSRIFGPDDELPKGVAALITNPKAWEDGVLPEPESKSYEDHTVPELKALIDSRNEGRDDAAKVPSDGNKPDLIAALEADDEAQQA